MKQKFSIILFLILQTGILFAQREFTPYDEIQGINKNYKPAYQDDYPDWAKMLYSYPVNFLRITTAYERYNLAHPGEKSAIIRYFKIWKRAIEPYILADGTIQLPDLKVTERRLYQAQLNPNFNRTKSAENNSNWTFVGPKETYWLNESGSSTSPASCPWQANVYSFDISRTNNNIIYCGTETGFVNKSINKGLSWQMQSPGYPFGGAVTAVAIHPENENMVYVAAGKQIHKTVDGGITWSPLLPPGTVISADRLKINSSNPSMLVAAASEGVFISKDNGLTWSKKWSVRAWDVEFNPSNPSIIYAITKSGSYFSAIQSVNEGESFQTIPGFPSNVTESSGGLLAVSKANPGALWAIMLSSDKTPYIYKGIVSNGNWSWSMLAVGKTTELKLDNGQGYFDLVLEVSPNYENIVFAGTTTLYKSINGGRNYSAVGGYSGNFSIHPDIQDMKILENGETWVSTDGGMVYSTDYFTNQSNYFVRINGLIGSDMWGFDQGWNEDLIVGGRYHNGNTAISSNYNDKALRMGGAESPTGWVLQGKSRHVAFSDLGNGWILPKTAEAKPEGRFIFSKYPNMEEYGGRRGNLVHHPNYYGTIYVGEGNGFWRSKDLGVNFDLLFSFPDKIRYFQQSYKNPDVFYADIVGYGLFKTTDGGKNWIHKPSLTNGTYASGYWNGKLFIAISPYNENDVYVCLQNGTWTSDKGLIYKSSDGGETWANLTGSLNEFTKCMVIQPTEKGTDLVYLFTSSRSGIPGKVFYREAGMNDWADFGINYPAVMDVNLALPFFRDGKIRVGGNGGVWESPMKEQVFTPILNPWVEKEKYNCLNDTLYFDDHSIINHEGAKWEWKITPTPAFIINSQIRNPKVVLGNPGNYSVTMSISQNGKTYSKTIENMVTTTTCPSIDNCNNPAELPKTNWSVVYFDSQETNYPGLAKMVIDGDPNTIWHTRWSTGTDSHPHELQVDMGQNYNIQKFIYLPRQDGQNGRIKGYEIYFSNDKTKWGSPVFTGEFTNSSAPATLTLPTPQNARYFKLRGLSEINGGAWTSIAELSAIGCIEKSTSVNLKPLMDELKAFPVPADNWITVDLPSGNDFQLNIYSIDGQLIEQKKIEKEVKNLHLNIEEYNRGTYILYLKESLGTTYRTKIIKQ